MPQVQNIQANQAVSNQAVSNQTVSNQTVSNQANTSQEQPALFSGKLTGLANLLTHLFDFSESQIARFSSDNFTRLKSDAEMALNEIHAAQTAYQNAILFISKDNDRYISEGKEALLALSEAAATVFSIYQTNRLV